MNIPNIVNKWKLILAAALLTTLAIGGIFTYQWVKKLGYLPIEVVSFSETLRYEDPDQIRALVTPIAAQGFFACDLNLLKENLENLPWIAKATVQRKWPNKLQIHLTEHQPLAIWEDKGVVNAAGHLFFPSTLTNVGNLPKFAGDQIYIPDMVELYAVLLRKLQPLGLNVVKLYIMPDQGWRVVLEDGTMLILGRQELIERLQRFVLAYTSKLNSMRDRIKVVDLRYTNGLAVG